MHTLAIAAILLALGLAGGCAGAPNRPVVTAPPMQTETPDPGITPGENQLLPPLAPGKVRVARTDGRVVLCWQGAGNTGGSYAIYRRSSETAEWQAAGQVEAVPGDQTEYRWSDPAPIPGALYGVEAVSPGGLRSGITVP